jgi:paraquat-inducible protein A
MLGGRGFLLACAVVAASALLALSFHLPFMRMSGLLLPGHGPQEHSLISAVSALVQSDQVFLGSLLLALSIFLPLLKLLYLLLLATLPRAEIVRSAAPLGALAWLGRWSRSDLVALALTAALVASRDTLAQRVAGAAYCFAAAVLIMALADTWLRRDGAGRRLRAAVAHAAARRGPAFMALVALAVAAFALGVTLPVVQLRYADAAARPDSIVGIVLALRTRGETTLWVALLALGILLPALRLLYLLTVAAARALPPAIRGKAMVAADALGRHATVDTMVLSLALLYLIATRQADAALQPGVYCLAASAGLALAAYAWVNLPSAASAQPSSLAARLAGLGSAEEAGMRDAGAYGRGQTRRV